MSKLKFDYVPLTFISDKEEIKKQIRNTIILIHLFEKYKNPVRLEKLIVSTQYGYNASALASGNNKFLRISDIHESKVNWESVPYCNCDDEDTYLLKNDDILIARTGGTTGKSFKIYSPPEHSIYAGYLIRIRAKKEVNPDYIYLFLHSFAYWSQIVNLNERNFRPKANAENLKSLILPRCERIIQDQAVRISQGEKVIGYEDLILKIEKTLLEFEHTQQVGKLLATQLTQIENLNQAILQEAVQGKLVKQDPRDEPATELLKRIKIEKAKLGKKEKPLLPIKPEEMPFEIPKNWKWCRFEELTSLITCGIASTPKYHKSGRIFLSAKNIKPFRFLPNDFKYVDEETYRKVTQNAKPEMGDVLITRVGAGIGETAVIDQEIDFAFYVSLTLVKPIRIGLDSNYLAYWLNSSFGIQNAIVQTSGIGSNQGNLNVNRVRSFLIPLPPLSEQKRIVVEIEKQFVKTKKLKEHILANQQATEHLLKALLHQAFEVKQNN